MNEITNKLTASGAAELLSLSQRQVQRLATNGKLEGAKFGRDWCFDRAAVMDYKSTERKPGRPKKSV